MDAQTTAQTVKSILHYKWNNYVITICVVLLGIWGYCGRLQYSKGLKRYLEGNS